MPTEDIHFVPTLLQALAAVLLQAGALQSQDVRDRSPMMVCLQQDGERAYVVERTADAVAVVDLRVRTVLHSIPVGPRPVHAVLGPLSTELFVSIQHGSRVDVIDLKSARVVRSLPCGHEPAGLAMSRDGRTLFAVNSLSGSVSYLDPASGRTLREPAVGRQPRYLTESADGSRLIVGVGLGREVAILAAATGEVLERRSVGRGNIVRDVARTKDGRWAFAVHVVSHDEVVPTQIERGWIHSNGITVFDLHRPAHRLTLLLDRVLEGAANPWGLQLSADEQRLYVSLAGVHQIAILDLPALLELVSTTADEMVVPLEQDVDILTRQRILRRVGSGGLGPRGITLDETRGQLLVANYFSDTITVLDAGSGALQATIQLGTPHEPSLWRQGELLFNDARINHQGWFTCASCHQEDATMDGLNWDLTNDGTGNPKNVKSLHDGHDTPPAMWTGVRENLDAAVAAGQRFQGFVPDPRNHAALMHFLSRPPRAPNPFRGQDPAAERRGEQVFVAARCHACHPAPTYSDLRSHDLGLGLPTDPSAHFDTPSLRDCYRTAPYLHDGRAATLRSLFTDHDPGHRHGRTAALTGEQLDELLAYLRTL